MSQASFLRQFVPHPSLSGYVQSIVVVENEDPCREVVLPLIANGYPGIAFQVADHGPAFLGNDRMGNLFLYGQFVKPAALRVTGRFTFIAYFFYPHVLKSLTGIDGKELTDRRICPDVFQLARKSCLEDQLLHAGSLTHRLSILDNFVSRLAAGYDPHHQDQRRLLFATQAIQDSTGLRSLQTIQKELHLTERTFQRLFESHVGVSPRLFSRICQFQSAFRQINQGSGSARLSDIAYNNGYADQSHFSRTFSEFTSFSPGEYLKLSAPYRDEAQ